MTFPDLLRVFKFLLLVLALWLVRRSVGGVQIHWLRVSLRVIGSTFFFGCVILLSLPVLIQVGCSRTLITSRAPDGSAIIRVKEFCSFPDCVVDVTVQKNWWNEKKIASRDDCIVNFAHVAWSRDSGMAGIYVDTLYRRSIHQGYDLNANAAIPFAGVADLVRRSIVDEYKVQPRDLEPYGGDVLEWAHYPGDGSSRPGVEAFRHKYKWWRLP